MRVMYRMSAMVAIEEHAKPHMVVDEKESADCGWRQLPGLKAWHRFATSAVNIELRKSRLRVVTTA